MASKRSMVIAVALVGVFALSTAIPMVEASHIKRLVWPTAQVETWIPVIAGYKVVPDPLQCNHGTPAGNVLYQNNFNAGLGSMSLINPQIGPRHPNTNLFHVTSFAGDGTDAGHSAGNRLYMGIDSRGDFHQGFFQVLSGLTWTQSIPAGAGAYFLSFNTKWETEWLEGYDHMWVEAIPADGRTYILCTLNPEGRGDPSSSETQSLGACSPYGVAGICPSSAKRLNNAGVPVYAVDASAPHWEARFVPIPALWNGQDVKLRLTFDSADGVSNTYLGWMVDDVTVSDAVIPAPTALPVVTGVVG